MEPFVELGDEIEQIWRNQQYDEEALPAIAVDALRRADLPSRITAYEVLDWTLRQTELPTQRDPKARFGDPPITLYVAPRFHIDVYFWFQGTTEIHQHGFCGAFQVLAGSSIHSWYEFDRRESLNFFTEIGEMRLKVCELLNVGDIQEIWPGKRYIHSLFHLDHPSATIVVRTSRSPLELPQFEYHKPFLAIDSFFDHDTTNRKLHVITAMIRIDEEAAMQRVLDLLETCDLQTTFQVLSTIRRSTGFSHFGRMFGVNRSNENFDILIAAAETKHPAAKGVFSAIFEYRDRSFDLVDRRSFVTNPEHRFFFALLLNVEGRERIFDLIRDRFPDSEPIDKVLDWTYDLSNLRVMGSSTINALGFESFDDQDMFILEHLLKGRSDNEIEAAVTTEYPSERSTVLLPELSERIDRIRRSATFKPLMS